MQTDNQIRFANTNTNTNTRGNFTHTRVPFKHCQRHNWPKALSTLTFILVPRRSFNKIWNLQHGFVWQREEIIEQLWQIHETNPCGNFQTNKQKFLKISQNFSKISQNFSTWQFFLHKYNLWYLWQIWALLSNPCNKLEECMYQFWEIHATAQRYTCNNIEKSNNLKFNKAGEWLREWKGKAMIGLESDKN